VDGEQAEIEMRLLEVGNHVGAIMPSVTRLGHQAVDPGPRDR
jgi:hypothetical protein